MQKKDDLVHRSEHPVLNSPTWLKKLTMILTSVLLLTMFGLGGYWLGATQRQASPTAVQQPSPVPSIATRRTEPIANWLTFTDSSDHYSFLYPPNWRLNAWTGGGVVELYSWSATEERKEIVPQSEIYIIIHVFENPQRLTIEQWFDARWGSGRDKSHEQVVSVNGLRAIKQVVTDLVAPLRFISFTFASGDKVYSIRAQPPNSRYLPEFEQIVRSVGNQQIWDTFLMKRTG